MKVIVDTNVFIDSIFHNDEFCNEILRREHKGELCFVMSNVISEELLNTVFFHAKEAGVTLEEFEQPFKKLCRTFRRVFPVEPTIKTKYCKHDKDEKFIECAIDGNIKYIVSSDGHLLKVEQEIRNNNNAKIEILQPEDFLNTHNIYQLKQWERKSKV